MAASAAFSREPSVVIWTFCSLASFSDTSNAADIFASVSRSAAVCWLRSAIWARALCDISRSSKRALPDCSNWPAMAVISACNSSRSACSAATSWLRPASSSTWVNIFDSSVSMVFSAAASFCSVSSAPWRSLPMAIFRSSRRATEIWSSWDNCATFFCNPSLARRSSDRSSASSLTWFWNLSNA